MPRPRVVVMRHIIKGDIVYYSGWDSGPHFSGYPSNTAKYLGVVVDFELKSPGVLAIVAWFLESSIEETKEYIHCLKILK